MIEILRCSERRGVIRCTYLHGPYEIWAHNDGNVAVIKGDVILSDKEYEEYLKMDIKLSEIYNEEEL